MAILFIGGLGAYFFFSRPAVPRQEDDGMARHDIAAAPVIEDVRDGETFALEAGFVEKEIQGRTNQMMAYNGSIPGPVLRVPQGATITVRFTNALEEPTTVHWHGIRVAHGNDGVPHGDEGPVMPGETFAYTLRFPDAGLYWYHPHVREDKQQDLGLYGNILVVPADAAYWPAAASEQFLTLDDVLAYQGYLAPHYDDVADHALMGRFGNVLLASGVEGVRMDAVAGEPARFYMTNTANTRPFRVSFGDAVMTLVGGDGGRLERPEAVESVVLAPSERAIVDVVFPAAGEYPIVHTTPAKKYRLGTVVVAAGNRGARAESTSLHDADDFAAIRPHLAKAVDATWRLDVATSHVMHHVDGGDPIEWEDDMPAMNAHMTNATTEWKIIDNASGAENEEIQAKWRTGDFVKIRIVNPANGRHPMQHPIHLHGQRFVVSAIDGVANRNLVWKDTVLVPKGSTADIVVEMTNPGEWMAHCHIAEHLESGMMTTFSVTGDDLVGGTTH